MPTDIHQFNSLWTGEDAAIAERLRSLIDQGLPEAESKIWHAHPVWFLAGNPIVGYSKEKRGVRLMFWSGADFYEDRLSVRGGKFKDASVFFTQADEVVAEEMARWLQKGREIQWDYKNIVKRKGKLERLPQP